MENANVKYLVGDVFDKMKELPDSSVDLVLTSPPFLALRSYLPADHPDKTKEIGSEATPAEFVDTLLRLTAEWRRLLAPHGSLCVELGDTFSGSGGGGGDFMPGSGEFDRFDPLIVEKPPKQDNSTGGWPLAKSLTLIPEAYRFALAYGTNPHTGTKSPAGQWRIRNVIRWVRPNPPVGALGDKFRPATSELVVACVSKDRYFDLDAVREPLTERAQAEITQGGVSGGESYQGEASDWNGYKGERLRMPAAGGGAPPLDWWKISPKGYAGAHYAVWPSELCVKPIKAMSPREVCRECGEPRRRVVDVEPSPNEGNWYHQGQDGGSATGGTFRTVRKSTTLGWSDCGHDNYRPGLVLDPFAGTGTTLAVAHGHGRDAIGIDIDERSAELARERVGPLFLEVVGLADGLRV